MGTRTAGGGALALAEAAANGQTAVVRCCAFGSTCCWVRWHTRRPYARTPAQPHARVPTVQVGRLLEHEGADVNAAGKGERSVVDHAVFAPSTHVCACAACQADGTTPLCAAALWGDCAMVRLLLSHGADPNATNSGAAVSSVVHKCSLALISGLLVSSQVPCGRRCMPPRFRSTAK